METFKACILLAVMTVCCGQECVDVSAFNIQILGKTKMGRPAVVQSLVEILSLYDISLIQEIRDSSNTAFPKLFDTFVENNPETKDLWTFFTGPRLGRKLSKEQYGFIYRTDKFELLDHLTYWDEGDIFEREPEIGFFRLRECRDIRFLIIVCHVKPRDAPVEIDALLDVYEWAKNLYETENAIITGDFNAGCSYLNKKERAASKILHDERFMSLFDDDTDTTVSATDCPYDRMFIAGAELQEAVEKKSAHIFHFDADQGLTNEEAKKVSDHYPIAATFCCSLDKQ